MSVALVTGGSRGLGLALGRRLVAEGWSLVTDARGAEELDAARSALEDAAAGGTRVVALVGDVADDGHRRELVAAVRTLGRLEVLVNNASLLGPSPQPALAAWPLGELNRVYEVNVVAPLALTQLVLPDLRASGGRVLNITSDAAVEAYEGWGGYGSSKAALEQLSRVLAAEEPAVRVYAVDPGDMRTRMHQEAFPGEDISDRPPPEVAVPGLLRLVRGELASGRYHARRLAPEAVGA